MEHTISDQNNSPENAPFQEIPIEKKSEQDILTEEVNTLSRIEQNLLGELESQDRSEIKNILEKIKNSEQTFLVMKNILERGRKETHFFDGLIEMDIYQAIIDGNLNAPKINQVKVKWSQRIDRYTATHNHLSGIKITDEIPSPLSILSSLVIRGSLPQEVEHLFHEMVHSTQHSFIEGFKIHKNNKNQIKPVKEDTQPTELHEAHAYRTANYPPESYNQELIIERILQSYDVEEKKLRYALEAIDQLQSLGLSIGEIGKLLILPEVWDNQRQIYPGIEAVILNKLDEQKRQPKDLEQLKKIYRLKRSIDSIKVQLLAREEIKKWETQDKMK